jgi:hypothetical protein
MAQRAGSANLPLHGGQVPQWLANRMTRLGAVISQAIVHHYGRDELLRRLAHPFWFQSFGAVMGMELAFFVDLFSARPVALSHCIEITTIFVFFSEPRARLCVIPV